MIGTYTLSHQTLFLNDQEDFDPLDVLVRSGDYFTVLASYLDDVMQNLELPDGDLRAELTLQQLVEDLLHLQEEYLIVKK